MRTGRVLSVVLTILVAITVAASSTSGEIRLMTWNVRGYPEDTAAERTLFSSTLTAYSPDILCIQEIANIDSVNTFKRTEIAYGSAAFTDSDDPLDTAIFARSNVSLSDMSDPTGFRHPAQLAYFSASVGSTPLVAYVLTVQLSYEDDARRAQERRTLAAWALPYIASGLNVIVAGDFNPQGGPNDTIDSLAQTLGMTVVKPSLGGSATTYAGSALDWILVSPSLVSAWCITVQIITPSDAALGEAISNHRPVLASFARKPCSTPESTQSSCSGVRLNEIDSNPAGTDDGNEWVELYNCGATAIDISGWVVAGTNGRQVEHPIPSGTTIQPAQYLLITHTKQWLDNEDEVVELRNTVGAVIDRIGPFSDTSESSAYARSVDGTGGWVKQPATKGYGNQ